METTEATIETMQPAEKTYRDMVLDSLSSARESVERAIAHYEGQRAEMVASHEQRVAEMDEHLTRLRGALSNGHAPRPAAVKATVGERIAFYLSSVSGRVLVADVAKALRLENAAVNAECRRLTDRFEVMRDGGRVYVELRRA